MQKQKGIELPKGKVLLRQVITLLQHCAHILRPLRLGSPDSMPTVAGTLAVAGITTLGAGSPFLGVGMLIPERFTFSLSPAFAEDGVCGSTTFFGAARRLFR